MPNTSYPARGKDDEIKKNQQKITETSKSKRVKGSEGEKGRMCGWGRGNPKQLQVCTNSITTPSWHPAQGTQGHNWCCLVVLFPNGRDRTREHRFILHTPDPIKFPSLEAVNSQHRQGQEEVDNKILWLCGSSGEQGINEKLRGETQPQPQGLKDLEELEGCALNMCPSLTASQGTYEALCATLINISMPAPHYPWIQHSLHSFSALVFTNSTSGWKI